MTLIVRYIQLAPATSHSITSECIRRACIGLTSPDTGRYRHAICQPAGQCGGGLVALAATTAEPQHWFI